MIFLKIIKLSVIYCLMFGLMMGVPAHQSFAEDPLEKGDLSDAVKTIKDDYLKTDDYEKGVWGETWETLKHDYFKAEEPVLNKNRKIKVEYMAQTRLLETPDKDNYLVGTPKIEEFVGMPDAYPYIFIHFEPKEDKPEAAGTTYLVVISRFYDRIVYADVFKEPKGDPFYRYHKVITEIKEMFTVE